MKWGLLFTILLALMPVATEADTPVELVLEPAQIEVAVGETFALDVWAYAGNQYVDSVDADLTFDADLLDVVSVTGDSGVLVFELCNVFDNAAGTLTHCRGRAFMMDELPSGDLHLFTAEFVAEAEGVAKLSFTNLSGAYFEGAQVLGLTSGATITVAAAIESLPYDMDGDCDVDTADVMLVASCWNQNGECLQYDLNGDSAVDVVDIMQVAAHWGEVCDR